MKPGELSNCPNCRRINCICKEQIGRSTSSPDEGKEKKQCPDCLCRGIKEDHVCPPWIKEIVRQKRENGEPLDDKHFFAGYMGTGKMYMGADDDFIGSEEEPIKQEVEDCQYRKEKKLICRMCKTIYSLTWNLCGNQKCLKITSLPMLSPLTIKHHIDERPKEFVFDEVPKGDSDCLRCGQEKGTEGKCSVYGKLYGKHLYSKVEDWRKELFRLASLVGTDSESPKEKLLEYVTKSIAEAEEHGYKKGLKEKHGEPCIDHAKCSGKHDMDDENFECKICGYAPDCVMCWKNEAVAEARKEERERIIDIMLKHCIEHDYDCLMEMVGYVIEDGDCDCSVAKISEIIDEIQK